MSWFTDLFSKHTKEIVEKSYKQPDQKVFESKPDEIKDVGNSYGLHPVFKDLIARTIGEATKVGLKVALFEGVRTFERQNYLYNVKKTTKVKGGGSWHQYGIAADIVFKDAKGRWTWESKDWQILGKIGKDYGLTWGGDWGWDMAHFEWHPMFKKTSEALALYNKGGIKAVHAFVDEWCKSEFKKGV